MDSLLTPDDGAQLGPGDLPVAGDQGEQEGTVLVLDHQGLDDVRGPDAQHARRPRRGCWRAAGVDDFDVQAAGRGVGQEPLASRPVGCVAGP